MLNTPRWHFGLIAAVILIGILYSLPNLFSEQARQSIPSWLPNEGVNLGLDLQGGSSLLLEVDFNSVRREQLEALVDTARTNLREAKIGYTDLAVRGSTVVVQLRNPEQSDEAREALLDPSGETLVSTHDDGSITITFFPQALAARNNSVMQQSIEIIRRRIDETGTKEPSIQRQGEDRILVQLPGIENPERMKDLIGQTAKLNFRFVNLNYPAVPGQVPPNYEVLTMEDESGAPTPYVVEKRVMVSGENLVNAQATFQTAQPVVSIRFDAAGARRFSKATQEGVNRLFAIVLDDKVISAPRINEPILQGNAVISGQFTIQEAEDLALLLRAGALPAPLTIIEERSVGPGLGADSIRAGAIACVLGIIFVIAFMVVTYGLFGFIADIALIINLVLILAVLSMLQATLTLPGIAGIVLTMGMAVDANVLIFERIREESRLGRGVASAVDVGFKRAIGTILDSNITTLIAAFLLFSLGSGPVKGFAVTLAIGLLTSMFTAIVISRAIVVTWLRARKAQKLPI